MSSTLYQFVRKCDIDISYRSDHSIIVLDICFSHVSHGKGLWKFNNALLHDLEFLDIINKKIDEIKLQYSLPVYDIDYVLDMKNKDINLTINDELFLETLLMEIRGKTISYSSYKVKVKNNYEKHLMEEISHIEQNLTINNKDRLLHLKNELNELRYNNIKCDSIR